MVARLCHTLGSLLVSGVDIVYGLGIATKATGNLIVRQRMIAAEKSLVEGKSLTESLQQTSLFPRAMLRLTASGEKTGQLGEMLLRSADYYENETNTDLSTLTTLAEPAIIIVLGAFIAFLLVAMYLPLFDLVGGI